MKRELSPETGPVVRVFFHYVIPSVFGMIAVSSAEVIDGIFVGKYVGADSLAAINLTIPLITLVSGIIIMLTVGSGVVCGKFLGEKNDTAASETMTQTVIITLAFCLMFIILGLIFIDPLISALGADDYLSGLVKEYLTIIIFFIPGFAGSFLLAGFVKIDGRPRLYFVSLLSAAAINIVLDALLVGILKMGLTGAALATSVAYTLSTFVALPHFFSGKARLRFVRPSRTWRIVLKALLNGFSEFINEISAGIVIFIFNIVMMRRFGAGGVAAFTIINYILWFGLMISYGVAEALQPLISTTFGAKQADRISAYTRYGLIVNGGIGLLLTAVILIFPDGIIGVFIRADEEQTIATARLFLVYFWPAMLVNGLNIAFSAYFTSLHKAAHSASIALARSLILPALLVLVLSMLIGDTGIFIAIPLAEFVTLGMSLIFFIRNRPKRIVTGGSKPIPLPEE